MFRIRLGFRHILIIAAATLLLLPALSIAQTTGEPAAETPEPGTEPVTPNADNPPPFIHDLMENSELTLDQMSQMRADGYGWGNIKLATELAEQLVSQGANTTSPLTFDAALSQIMTDRAQDMGFGEIAAKYGLKIGDLNRNGKPDAAAKSAGAGLNKPDKPERTAKMERVDRPERVERPMKPEKIERPEMPGRGPGR